MADFLLRIERLSHAKTQTIEMKMKQYDDWAPFYEDDVTKLCYRAPSKSVELLYQVVESEDITFDERTTVIDFAAGTGMVASALRQKHYPGKIDAQDGSAEMLEVARKRGLYTRIYHCILRPNIAMSLPLLYYDVAFLCGALSDSQVQTASLKDMLLHLKVGGIFVFSTRSNLSNLKYKEDLDAVVDGLSQSGVWQKLLVEQVEEFEKATSPSEVGATSSDRSGQSNPFITGTVYCYRKLK